MRKNRILSGMRPTGKLHLGHLFGAIKNWVELQKEYDCFYMIADWHALTTTFRDTGSINQDILEIVMDYVCGGIDPERCTLYVQSHISEIAELYVLLSPFVPVSWLLRCPSYKDQIQQLGDDVANFGFLGYPVLMTCDIIIVKGEIVPVGQDQLVHLELCREIVRRFHHFYGNVFPEPQAKLTEFPAVPGIDARKMSKSYGNAILISEEPESVRGKVRMMITDPQKIYKGDPGHPDICTVQYFQRIYGPEDEEQIAADCRSGKLGCVEHKKNLAEAMIRGLAPLQEKRRKLAQDPAKIEEILFEGARKARRLAAQTLAEVKEAMKIA